MELDSRKNEARTEIKQRQLLVEVSNLEFEIFPKLIYVL